MPYILTTIGALTTEGATGTVTSIDFGPMLETALNLITSDFAKYAMVAGAAGLVVWGAPKALLMVKRFFTAVSR